MEEILRAERHKDEFLICPAPSSEGESSSRAITKVELG